MITYIIYFLIAVILIFVLYLAVQAITRGVEAKNEISDEKKEENFNVDENNISIEISKLKKMFDEGIIDEEEFKKAKEKILK